MFSFLSSGENFQSWLCCHAGGTEKNSCDCHLWLCMCTHSFVRSVTMTVGLGCICDTYKPHPLSVTIPLQILLCKRSYSAQRLSLRFHTVWVVQSLFHCNFILRPFCFTKARSISIFCALRPWINFKALLGGFHNSSLSNEYMECSGKPKIGHFIYFRKFSIVCVKCV